MDVLLSQSMASTRMGGSLLSKAEVPESPGPPTQGIFLASWCPWLVGYYGTIKKNKK